MSLHCVSQIAKLARYEAARRAVRHARLHAVQRSGGVTVNRLASTPLIAILLGTTLGCNTSVDRSATTSTAPRSGGSESVNPSSVERLEAAGSSFIEPLMKQWAKQYLKAKSLEVNYNGNGSGAGIDSMTQKKVDFGCTDAPMTEDQLSKAKQQGGEVAHIPLVMGAVVPIYNLPGIEKPVRFTGPILADIFLGTIKKWNDPKLTELNSGVNLPNTEIQVVHRSDSSGTTYIWTDYLAKVSEGWKKVGVGTAINWPVGVGQPKNPGVANMVKMTPGSIGYVELIFALSNQLAYGAVQNASGAFIHAELQHVTAAAAGALKDIPADLRYSITNAPGQESYPISGTVWAICYVNQPPERAQAIVDFLRWITHEGQQSAEPLHYAQLPLALVARVDEKLAMIKPAK